MYKGTFCTMVNKAKSHVLWEVENSFLGRVVEWSGRGGVYTLIQESCKENYW